MTAGDHVAPEPAPIPQPRPVVDAAKTQTRNQRIVAAFVALVAFLPELLREFGIWAITDAQMADFIQFVNLAAGVALVFMAQETKNVALNVESQVTPTASPRLTQIVDLTAPTD